MFIPKRQSASNSNSKNDSSRKNQSNNENSNSYTTNGKYLDPTRYSQVADNIYEDRSTGKRFNIHGEEINE